jgi:hypothetical protein
LDYFHGFGYVNKIQWTEPVLWLAARHNPPLHLSPVKDSDNCTVICFNPLTPEFNPSPQHCLPKFLQGILIFKGLAARRLYKSFGVKMLTTKTFIYIQKFYLHIPYLSHDKYHFPQHH